MFNSYTLFLKLSFCKYLYDLKRSLKCLCIDTALKALALTIIFFRLHEFVIYSTGECCDDCFCKTVIHYQNPNYINSNNSEKLRENDL